MVCESTVTDTEQGLDLSILAQVDNTPDADERPQTDRSQTTGGAPRGATTDEVHPRSRRSRGIRKGGTRARADAPSDPRGPDPVREFIRADDVDELLPDYHPGMFVKPLTEAYMTVGAMLLPINQPIGTAIMQNAENCAKSLDNAAKVDKKVRKYLLSLLGTSVWIPVLIAHMPIMTTTAVVLFPAKKPPEVQLPENGPGETINPVSNGYRRTP
jgi:hypothetical protein